MNPPIIVDDVLSNCFHIKVVRDDLLEGGTKQRAIVPFLKKLQNEGFREFVYASPFAGYAQVALAISCSNLGLKSTIFVEQQNNKLSEISQLIAQYSNLVGASTLDEAISLASNYEEENKGRYNIPLGFDSELYRAELHRALSLQWKTLSKYRPKRMWVSVGSGTLASTLRSIIPDYIKLMCVNVGVLGETDTRIRQIHSLKNTEYFVAPEKFHNVVESPPPISSNKFYDAKVWQFIKGKGRPGDVWWNVAK